MKPIEPREYAIRPELRRCCWYGIVGVFVVAGCLWAFRHFLGLPQPSIAETAPLWCVGGVIIAVLLIGLRWRLRIDRYGLWRSFFFSWEQWAWEDFANGNIQKQRGATLYNANRPWWNRTLRFGLIAPADIAEVYAAINEHFELPAPPELPDSAVINYGLFHRNSVTLCSEGLKVRHGVDEFEYEWSDVRDVHMLREEPLRRDFSSLLVTLPDREIELKVVRTQHTSHDNWSGATREVVAAYLVRHAPAQTVHIDVAGEPITSRAFLKNQLNDFEKRFRGLRVMWFVFGPILAGLFLWFVFDVGLLPTLFMFSFPFLFYGPIFYLLYRKSAASKRELEENLAMLEEATESRAANTHSIHGDAR